MQGDFFGRLESSWLAAHIRESVFLFPFIETLHIIGFVFLTGSAFLFDLRLLGVARSIPVSSVAGYVLPWSRRSLLVVIPTGLLLFISQANSMIHNPVFITKLILIVVALVNAGVFHYFVFSSVSGWNVAGVSPLSAKVCAVISLLVWMLIIGCGRFIAYI